MTHYYTWTDSEQLHTFTPSIFTNLITCSKATQWLLNYKWSYTLLIVGDTVQLFPYIFIWPTSIFEPSDCSDWTAKKLTVEDHYIRMSPSPSLFQDCPLSSIKTSTVSNQPAGRADHTIGHLKWSTSTALLIRRGIGWTRAGNVKWVSWWWWWCRKWDIWALYGGYLMARRVIRI